MKTYRKFAKAIIEKSNVGYWRVFIQHINTPSDGAFIDSKKSFESIEAAKKFCNDNKIIITKNETIR